jgi:hypothetical protein
MVKERIKSFVAVSGKLLYDSAGVWAASESNVDKGEASNAERRTKTS